MLDVMNSTVDFVRLAQPLLRHTVVVHDTVACNGSFLMQYLAKAALSEHLLVAVGVDYNELHYNRVLAKLGVNWAQCVSEGRARFVDVLNACRDWDWDDSGTAPRIAHMIKQALEQLTAAREEAALPAAGCVLLIDSLSTISALLGATPDADGSLALLIHHCRTMPGISAVVCRVHADTDVDRAWHRHLHSVAATHLSLDALRTGRSHDMQAQLSIHVRRLPTPPPAPTGGAAEKSEAATHGRTSRPRSVGDDDAAAHSGSGAAEPELDTTRFVHKTLFLRLAESGVRFLSRPVL
ncbi:unnamed protein product [Pedinophyceae sp. YPF-701]|nr:unnamed protein product [Pedinophyceae sp. YPF-701]